MSKERGTPTRRDVVASGLTAGSLALAMPVWAADAVPDVVGKGRRWDADVGLVGEPSAGPGYSTTMVRGTWVHATRANLDYALRLLDTGDAGARARAESVIAKVIALQDVDPASPTFGVWPYYLEEPLAKMAPPDLNWADFNGARLTTAVNRHADRLSPDIKRQIAVATGRAARAIVKRNVGPSYTNIAAMGGRVTLIAGELLDAPDLIAYGRERLQRLLDHTREQGSFNEYNSPTYTIVALEEFDSVLSYARDAAARDAAEALRQIAWQVIASHWHPGTVQWAGPHARGYHDRTPNEALDAISARIGRALRPGAPNGIAPREAMLPCPEALLPRFAALAGAESEVRQRFIRAADDTASVYGTTWLSREACLGSASAEGFWVQRHPLIGYWQGPAAPAVLRVRCLKDGRDFASFGMVATQKGPRVLLSAHPIAGSGDWHISIDRSPDGTFKGQELRLRVVLSVAGARAQALGPYAVRLSAFGWQAVVHMGPVLWDGATDKGAWRVSSGKDEVYLDYVVPLGGTIAPTRLGPTSIPLAIELLPAAAAPSTAAVLVGRPVGGRRKVSWGGLDLVAPVAAPPVQERIS